MRQDKKKGRPDERPFRFRKNSEYLFWLFPDKWLIFLGDSRRPPVSQNFCPPPYAAVKAYNINILVSGNNYRVSSIINQERAFIF